MPNSRSVRSRSQISESNGDSSARALGAARRLASRCDDTRARASPRPATGTQRALLDELGDRAPRLRAAEAVVVAQVAVGRDAERARGARAAAAARVARRRRRRVEHVGAAARARAGRRARSKPRRRGARDLAGPEQPLERRPSRRDQPHQPPLRRGVAASLELARGDRTALARPSRGRARRSRALAADPRRRGPTRARRARRSIRQRNSGWSVDAAGATPRGPSTRTAARRLGERAVERVARVRAEPREQRAATASARAR